MRSILRTAAVAAAGLMLVPQLAAASDVEDQLRNMNERLEAMEDQLQAQSDDLAQAEATVQAQQAVIEEAALADERGEKNALSSFIEKTDFSGWVAVSYVINFESADDTVGGGANGLNAGAGPPGIWYPHHPDSNTFQVDQAWFAIDKAPTEESRAGFHIDLRGGSGSGAGGLTPSFYSAYASYLIPLLDGLQIDAGLMPTLIGAEVEQTNANFNVTRGLVWGIQPVTNAGGVASLAIGNFTVQAGVLNDVVGGIAIDDTSAPSLTSRVAYSAEKFGIGAGFVYGKDQAAATDYTGGAFGTNQSIGILDVLATADPLDNLSLWANYDYRFETNKASPVSATTDSVDTHGIAVAGRLGILDSLGAAIRYEIVMSKQNLNNVGLGTLNNTFQSVTLTGDWSPVDGLTFRPEYRFDYSAMDPVLVNGASAVALNGPGPFLPSEGAAGFTKNNQHVFLLQMMYEF